MPEAGLELGFHRPYSAQLPANAVGIGEVFRHDLGVVATRMIVELEIVETDPGVRGDTSGGGGKPARLETGAVVRVPLFVQQNEIVRVDTRTGDYQTRVSQ